MPQPVCCGSGMLNYSEATQGLVDIGGSGSKGLMSALRSAAAHRGYSALIPRGGQGDGGRGKRTDAFAKSAETACPRTRPSATVRATCGLSCRRPAPPRPAASGPRQPFGRAITADGKARDLFAAELDIVAEKTIDLWRPPDAQGAQQAAGPFVPPWARPHSPCSQCASWRRRRRQDRLVALDHRR